jgi:hypothetical protein
MACFIANHSADDLAAIGDVTKGLAPLEPDPPPRPNDHGAVTAPETTAACGGSRSGAGPA